MADYLTIAERKFTSRLIVGTGRYLSNAQMVDAVKASECEMVTVAVRRINLDSSNKKSIIDYLQTCKVDILPNTAGSKTAEEAIFTARLAREAIGTDWVKLEVIPDPHYLLPDPIGTIDAAKQLVLEGFKVLPYIGADPVLARRLEDMGCVTIMPLGSPIGSGRGILTLEEVAIIIEQASVPVIVDAGLGVPSHAAQAMEIGADAVLVNTAIAKANKPALMARAFNLGVSAGRKAFLSGRMDTNSTAVASSPKEGIPEQFTNI